MIDLVRRCDTKMDHQEDDNVIRFQRNDTSKAEEPISSGQRSGISIDGDGCVATFVLF